MLVEEQSCSLELVIDIITYISSDLLYIMLLIKLCYPILMLRSSMSGN